MGEWEGNRTLVAIKKKSKEMKRKGKKKVEKKTKKKRQKAIGVT